MTRTLSLACTALLLGATAACSAAQQAPRAPDPNALRELEAFFGAEAAAGRFSGVVAVGREGSPLFQKAWGMADRAKKIPNTVETRFNLGSMNKMFTSVAVAQLVSQGKLRFDDPLSRFHPDFPSAQDAPKVSVEHLLTHTSGLGSYFTPRYMRERPQTISGVMEVARENARLAFSPGSGWAYSNTGFLVLGSIIEKVSGKDYFTYVRDHVYGPAGMTRSGSPGFGEGDPDVALAYAPPGTLGPDTTVRTLYRGTSAGGGVSTAGDLLRFSDALLKGKLVSPEHVRLLTTPKPQVGSPGYGYGFGVDRGRGGLVITGHNGGAPGTFANLDIYPEQGYATVILMNNSNGEVADAYVERVRRAVEAILGVSPTAPRQQGAAGGQQGGRPPSAAVFEALLEAVAAGDEPAARKFAEEHMAPGFRGAVPLAQHVAEFRRINRALGRAELIGLRREATGERVARVRSGVDGRVYLVRLELTEALKVEGLRWGPEEGGG